LIGFFCSYIHYFERFIPGLNWVSQFFDLLPPAALPGAKLLKKFDQNFLLPFGRLLCQHGF
jgi:hypothetical protein